MVSARAVTDWLEDRRAEGWLVNHGDISVTGFPLEFRTTITALELADPETGWLWSVPELRLESAAVRPNRIRAVWPSEQVLASPLERLTIRSETMVSTLEIRPGTFFEIDLSRTLLRDLRVESDAGWQAVLREGTLDLTRQEGPQAAYDVAFAARDLMPPGPVGAALDPGRVLPATIESLTYRADMAFDRPWDLRAIAERRPQITALDLAELEAVWGGLVLRAAGALEVDADHLPEGALAVRAEAWREMVAMATRAGVIPAPMQATVEGVLEIVAGFSGDPEVIDAALRFADGRMFLGPLPIGPAPLLRLR
jgi:hypothetical protein